MYQVCFRKNNLSNDESLFPIMLTDIFSILEKYPSVERLVLTSRAEMYGALWLLKSYFLQRHAYFPKVASREDNILAGSFVFSQRNISILVPNAPLQNSITDGGITMQGMVLMYSTFLK